MMVQDFVGTTTIVPQVSFLDYFKVRDLRCVLECPQFREISYP
jgi:hypothetical protein